MRLLSKITSISIAVLLAFCTVSFNAAYFQQDGIVYDVLDSNYATVVSYDGDNPDLVFPNRLGNYYTYQINDYAMYNNVAIKSVSFGNADHLSKIGEFAFSGCTGIESIVIPRWLSTVSLGAFQDCTNLKSAVFYSSISTISDQLFYNCVNLESVDVPNSVKSIGNYAFSNCKSLSKIFIPKNTTSISKNAFSNCTNLTISGYFNSYAEKYANEMNIPFIGLSRYSIGDYNKDNEISIRDVTAIQVDLANDVNFKGEDLYLGDAEKDNNIDIRDVTTIQKYLVHIYDSLPIS